MNAPTLYLRPDVAAYVSAVRGHLDDLPAEVVDELTGGLEADLSELAAEAADPLEARVGPPGAYADELRAAAGLAPRAHRAGWWGRGHDRWRRDLGGLAEQSWWPGVRDFMVALRPAWWVARALVVAGIADLLVRSPLVDVVVFAVGAIISVELGRGRWSGRTLSVLVGIGNVVAALCLVVVGLGALSSVDRGNAMAYDQANGGPGIFHDDQPVTNVFAYDAQGHLLTGVQLFDQDGRPLSVDPDTLPVDETYQDDGSELRREAVPSIDAYGQQVWNVFPLSTIERRYPMDGGAPTPLSSPTAAPPRAVMVPPLLDAGPPPSAPADGATSGAAPGATSGATSGATPTAPDASSTGAAGEPTSSGRPSQPVTSTTPR